MPSDPELLEAWRAGDGAAADALMERHYASVRRFFDLEAAHVADDLTQQTFLAALEAVDRYRREAGFRAYLFGIARLQLLRFLRRKGRHDRAVRFAAASERGSRTSLSIVAARKQEHRLLLMAIAQLSTELQVVVQLYYWESMRTAEIAAVVASNESTVATRLARARKLVREHVTEMTQPGRLRDTLLADLDRWQRDAGTVATEANARTSTHHALG